VRPLVLQPSALFVPFIGGFLAPRGSYLIGFLIGVVQATFYSVWVVVGTVREAKLENLPSQLAPATPLVDTTRGDLAGSIVSIFVVCILFGTVAAAFASWYRNFLRNSQMRAQQNRAIRDKQSREKAKEREREQRIAERDARKSASRKVVP
jgi:threonine/homoserine/homoserine lactone efflux protein